MSELNNKSDYSILIVDDNPKNLSVLENMLSEEGYIVRSATSGKQALESIEAVKPDIILMDIHMPKMDGLELCSIIKADNHFNEIPVIFISALNDAFNIVEAFKIGGQDYITKPFNLEEVLARIEVHLSLKIKNLELKDALIKLKESEARLIQNEKLKSYGTIISGITHELNNPINYIKNGVETLEYNFNELLKIFNIINKDDKICIESCMEIKESLNNIGYSQIHEETSKLFEAVLIGVNKISEIIKTLKTFSKLNESETDIIDINKNILSVLQYLNYQFNDKLKVETNLKSKQKIKCYPLKFNQLILSLLNNAIEAINIKNNLSNEKITIETLDVIENKIDLIKIIITDTGIGISEEAGKKIFDPFFTTKEFGKYLGLGLTLCNQIVQELNGYIKFESKANKGSSFYIYLPKNN